MFALKTQSLMFAGQRFPGTCTVSPFASTAAVARPCGSAAAGAAGEADAEEAGLLDAAVGELAAAAALGASAKLETNSRSRALRASSPWSDRIANGVGHGLIESLRPGSAR